MLFTLTYAAGAELKSADILADSLEDAVTKLGFSPRPFILARLVEWSSKDGRALWIEKEFGRS